MADGKPRGSFRGNVFSPDGTEKFYLEVPADFYIALKSGKITDATLEEILLRAVKESSADSEQKESKMDGTNLMGRQEISPYNFKPEEVDYGKSLDSHTDAFEKETEKMDSFLVKIKEALDKRKDANGKYKKLVEDFSNISIKAGYGIFKSFEQIKPAGMQDYKLRNELYKGIVSSINSLADYFTIINTKLAKDNSFDASQFDVLTLFHGLSKICTKLLDRQRDAGMVRPEVVKVIDNIYETLYDTRTMYALDEFEQIRENLRKRVDLDLQHKIKTPGGDNFADKEKTIKMNDPEIEYDNLNFLDDSILHFTKYVFGVDAKKYKG